MPSCETGRPVRTSVSEALAGCDAVAGRLVVGRWASSAPVCLGFAVAFAADGIDFAVAEEAFKAAADALFRAEAVGNAADSGLAESSSAAIRGCNESEMAPLADGCWM